MVEAAVRMTVDNTSPAQLEPPFDDLAMLFHYEFMVHAFEAGTVVAIVAGAIGYFVVLRGSAFAAHALSHIGFAGATGAVVLGDQPDRRLARLHARRGVAIGALGSRLRGRDVTIGIVLAWTLGLGVLFISLYRRLCDRGLRAALRRDPGHQQSDVVVTLVAGLTTIAAPGRGLPPAAVLVRRRGAGRAPRECR